MNNAKKKKPLRRAKHWGARVWPMAGRMAVILVAVAVMGLMFSALQAVSSIVLRDIISLAILSGILLTRTRAMRRTGLKSWGGR